MKIVGPTIVHWYDIADKNDDDNRDGFICCYLYAPGSYLIIGYITMSVTDPLFKLMPTFHQQAIIEYHFADILTLAVPLNDFGRFVGSFEECFLIN